MAKRLKRAVNVGITREQADTAFGEFAKADAREAEINAIMNKEFTKTRNKYQDELAELSTTKEEQFAIMEDYAIENRELLFSKKKSLETVHGTLGFRTSNPALKNLKGFTWASVTQLLKEFLPEYVRTKEEPDKDRLLADRNDEEVFNEFKRCGISVVQVETFFVEPKKEETK